MQCSSRFCASPAMLCHTDRLAGDSPTGRYWCQGDLGKGTLYIGPCFHPPKGTIHSKQLTTSLGFPQTAMLDRCDVGPKATKGVYSNNKTSYNKIQIDGKHLLNSDKLLSHLSTAKNFFRSSSIWAWTFSVLVIWVTTVSLSCCRFSMSSSTIFRQFSSAWMEMIYIVDLPSSTLIRSIDHFIINTTKPAIPR